ncbi:MAG: helix-turn-helix domain-containing protein [Kofleriaceae bacterium]|nr:helix-turn-helix domain-containing protein [Kofleriaceae bacterium]
MPTTTLGAFLIRTRESRTPDAATRTPGRRRVKGLRREEVALAAGISPTWYTWLEQGRPVTCSRTTLESVARALRMSATERRHLFDLADANLEPPPPLVTRVPSQLATFVDATQHPAYVFNALWDVLHVNAAATTLFGPFTHANVLRRLFLDDTWRFKNADAIAQSAVAQFRAATGRFQYSDAFQALVGGLADASPAFRTLWERKQLEPPPLTQKILLHATGPIALHYATMRPDGFDDVSIAIYVRRCA